MLSVQAVTRFSGFESHSGLKPNNSGVSPILKWGEGSKGSSRGVVADVDRDDWLDYEIINCKLEVDCGVTSNCGGG